MWESGEGGRESSMNGGRCGCLRRANETRGRVMCSGICGTSKGVMRVIFLANIDGRAGDYDDDDDD